MCIPELGLAENSLKHVALEEGWGTNFAVFANGLWLLLLLLLVFYVLTFS